MAGDAHRQGIHVPARPDVLLAGRVWHTGDGSELSNWSATLTFKTPKTPAAAPASAPAPAPLRSRSTRHRRRWQWRRWWRWRERPELRACSSSAGNDIAECIEARYPPYLQRGVSLTQRKSNMQFLRDRMIEHGKCRGLHLGLNLKRGGPTISNDFIVWRRPGQSDMGVDIGSGVRRYPPSVEPVVAYIRRIRQLRLIRSTRITAAPSAVDGACVFCRYGGPAKAGPLLVLRYTCPACRIVCSKAFPAISAAAPNPTFCSPRNTTSTRSTIRISPARSAARATSA